MTVCLYLHTWLVVKQISPFSEAPAHDGSAVTSDTDKLDGLQLWYFLLLGFILNRKTVADWCLHKEILPESIQCITAWRSHSRGIYGNLQHGLKKLWQTDSLLLDMRVKMLFAWGSLPEFYATLTLTSLSSLFHLYVSQKLESETYHIMTYSDPCL